MLYISLDSYTRDDIERICELPQVHGALLGDLFCQRRMFEGGAPELWKMAKNLTAARKRVIYQTPFYLTERYYEGELLQIRSLAQSDILHGLIVQDIGLLDEINQMKRKGISSIRRVKYSQKVVRLISILRRTRQMLISYIMYITKKACLTNRWV